MTKRKKIILWIVGTLVALAAIGALTDGGDKKSSPGASASSPAQLDTAPPPSPQATPKASISVVHGLSSCIADADNAQITFFVELKNKGNAAGKTQIRPWRRYNDGSVNDGIADTTEDVSIPAESALRIRTMVPFDPTDHLPIACRVYLGDDTDHYSSIVVQ